MARATSMIWPFSTGRATPGRCKVGLLLALLAACATAGLGADTFEFVVIGDTRPRFESENFREFEAQIPKVNSLKPAFVINVGDLIYGYGPLSKEKQWDKYEEAIKSLEVPYYQLPGNHDTHSKEARRIYGRRFDKFYYSFDSADCHFVLLDSTEQGRWGYIGSAQLEWLKNDLKQSGPRPVFVFLHFPIWEPGRLAPQYYEFWRDTLHPLFKESRVRAVFGGHLHAYGPTREFDGIRYFITGGGGAELIPAYRKAGGQHHFLRVKVAPDTCTVRVVTAQGELSDPEADIMGGFLFADRNSSRVGINPGTQRLTDGVSFAYSLHNPYTEPMSGTAEWSFDASVFEVEPKMISVQVPAGRTRDYSFTLSALKETSTLASSPRLEFNVVAGARRHRFHRDVHFVQGVTTAYRDTAPRLDGQIADWSAIAAVRLEPGAPSAPELRSLHDLEYLYLALTTPAMESAEKDESAFPDDLQVGLARRRAENEFGGDFLRLGFEADAPGARNRMPGSAPGATVPGVRSAAHTERGTTTFELAIPLRLLKHVGTGSRGRLILNLSFPVPDGEGDEPAPAMNSFAYRVRYGTGALVPIHFVELDLEKGRGQALSPGTEP